MTHLASSRSPIEPPTWWLEMCVGCHRYLAPELYQLSSCCSCNKCAHDDRRHLFAVAWICDHCDYVLELVGLFTNWPAALDARRRALKQRELNPTSLWHGPDHASTTNVADTFTTNGA